MKTNVSRRHFIASGGALVLTFSFAPELVAQAPAQPTVAPPALAGSLHDFPLLDSWIRIGSDGSITVLTGKVEFGQGVKTALIQLAAEELVVEPASITLITADTALTPNEGYTSGSQSMQYSGTAIMNAAAQVRGILLGLAAARLSVPADQLTVRNGSIRAADGRTLRYAELVTGQDLHVRAEPRSLLGDPNVRTVMGQPLPRVDIPGKVTGGAAYVQDLRLPGTVHARVVRPPSYGATLVDLDTQAVEKMPGVLRIVRDGNFVAVVAQREYQAVVALRALRAAARWKETATLPVQSGLYAFLQQLPAQDRVDLGQAAAPRTTQLALDATFHRPYQIHGSIGPSCAVGLYKDDTLTVWTHSQGVFPLRDALAEMLGMPSERVHCIHVEGSGCYGHNGADDAAADAALVAHAFPGRPVRVQWMREDEHTWEPFGSAMTAKVQASLDDGGDVASWNYEVWSCSHSTRPAPAGNLAPAWSLRKPFAQPAPKPVPLPNGDGDRNAVPLYRFPDPRVIFHFTEKMPLRVSALRGLGAYANVFAIESAMDDLAKVAGADPVEFRLRHLDDPRAQDVIRMAAQRFDWAGFQKRAGRGRGFAYARYKTLATYAALAFEVDVDRETGRVRVVRAVAAVDSGEAVNPNGLRNQIEGGIIQSISWTLFEAVTFDTTHITSSDWSRYPILRFPDLPDSVDVHVINRPGLPFLGAGEAAQGPAAAALANAVADAVGARIRELPLSPGRVKAAIGA